MNTLSIADYTDAHAECGEAGINLATLELTDIPGSDPGPDVSNRPTPCQASAFLLSDGHGRDPDKYRWLAADPRPAPRLPREKPITYVKFWLIVTAFMGTVALECWGVWALGKWVAG